MTNHEQQIANEVTHLIQAAVDSGMENDPRTQQSRAGKIGPSDIGFCRQKTVLTMRQVMPTDNTDMWAALVGTAVHIRLADYLQAAYGDTWIIEKAKVTAHLPHSNADISGTADLVLPEYNLLLDVKTVDGLKTVQTYGPSQNHQYQRHLYALGAIDAGMLDGSKQVYVGNVYIDISRTNNGEQGKVWTAVEPMNDALTDEIDTWVEDVLYAVKYNEDASRDIAAPVCERICQFYTACRGALPTSEYEPFTDPQITQAIDLYVRGREMERDGVQMKREGAQVLTGLNGSDGTWQVRTVNIAASEVPGFTRKASTRLDVRKMRKQR